MFLFNNMKMQIKKVFNKCFFSKSVVSYNNGNFNSSVSCNSESFKYVKFEVDCCWVDFIFYYFDISNVYNVVVVLIEFLLEENVVNVQKNIDKEMVRCCR